MLSEKLYELRRKAGLSQEELAERLDVSRQAVSKWESGTARPDVDRLQALSRFYGVPMEALLSDDPLPAPGESPAPSGEKPAGMKAAGEGKRRSGPALLSLGVILAFAGALLLLLRGLLALLAPAAAERIAESSVIHIDGGGILAIAAVLLLAAGVLLLILPKKR
ncbi:MAG: helix-turn-helix transcriptional regulator [Clostridia bacterium]|nr:helix-turn-helix transcriptional regulator [Clostridia bacterium]